MSHFIFLSVILHAMATFVCGWFLPYHPFSDLFILVVGWTCIYALVQAARRTNPQICLCIWQKHTLRGFFIAGAVINLFFALQMGPSSPLTYAFSFLLVGTAINSIILGRNQLM